MQKRTRVLSVALVVGLTAGASRALADSNGGGAEASIAQSQTAYVPMTPCRLVDTRPAPASIGGRSRPLTSGETLDVAVTNLQSNCSLPASAVAISYNLTVPSPTTSSVLKVFAGDAEEPETSSLNTTEKRGTVANGGITAIGAAGTVKVNVSRGPIDVILDVTGYFVPSEESGTGPAGPIGPEGPAGVAGATGPAGPAGAPGPAAWEAIPSGTTVTGYVGESGSYLGGDWFSYVVALPGVAPLALTATDVDFAVDADAATTDDDATCTGSVSAPTAPPGQVCVYPEIVTGVTSVAGGASTHLTSQHFVIGGFSAGGTQYFYATWAYTAP